MSDVPQSAVLTAYLQTTFDSDSPVGKAILDQDLRYTFINETLAAFNGRSIEEHIGRSVREVLPEAYPSLEPHLREVLERGVALRNFRVSVELPNAPGELSEWEASYLPIRLPGGGIGGIYVQAVNLTAKLKAERALANSEQQLRRVLDSIFAFVGVLNPDGTLTQANKAPLEAAGIRASEVIGKKFWDTYWWNFSDASRDWVRDVIARAAQGEVIRQDVDARMAGDSRMTLDFMIVPMRDDEGRITHLIPSAIDITDRRVAQSRIESALSERTLLLQEIHHRVKNNLQIIASLLRLQARSASADAQQALQDSQSRVMAIAMTHQLLYEHHDFSALELGPYLSRLSGSIRDGHGGLSERVRLVLDAPATGLRIDLDQAVPVALVINELVTNAFKHGFPDGRQGTIEVSAWRADGQLSIRVKDSGAGLPPQALQVSRQGLGFNLVRLLTEQLQATMVWPTPGDADTSFTLHLPARLDPR